MRNRLHELGWREVEVLYDDLGRSAAGTVARAGFERMVAEVCLGKVGAVAAREGFAVCQEQPGVATTGGSMPHRRYSADRSRDGVCTPTKHRSSFARVKRQLEQIRAGTASSAFGGSTSRKGQARRTADQSTRGYIKTEEQRLEKNPNRRVQEAISLVFRKFRERGTVRQKFAVVSGTRT